MTMGAKSKSEWKGTEFHGEPISRESNFEDASWTFDIPQVTRKYRTFSWHVELGDDGYLTDGRHEQLLWSCKALCFLMLTTAYGPHGKVAKPTTVMLVATSLRLLIQWMTRNGLSTFCDLNETEIKRYRAFILKRHPLGSKKVNNGPSATGEGETLSWSRTNHLLQPLRLLLTLRNRIPFQPQGDVIGLRDALRLDKNDQAMESSTPVIPDEVAISLYSIALKWVFDYGDLLVKAQRIIAVGRKASKAKARGDRASTARRALNASFSGNVNEAIVYIGSERVCLADINLITFHQLIVLLESACFIVIAGMVGPRMSEIGSLRVGCLDSVATSRGTPLLLVRGKVFKTVNDKDGADWQWVAGWDKPDNPVRRAVEILEALRAIDYSTDTCLFVSTWGRIDGSASGIVAEYHNKRVNEFARKHGVGNWTFASHQFRRWFARFVTKRDFTGLVALQEHFGHMSLLMTEYYAYWDDALIQDVLDADIEQDYEVLERVLSASVLAGKMGETILARNERFRGLVGKEALRAEIDALRTEISDDPVIVMRHDYGYCLLIEDQAACGTERWKVGIGTCAPCPNLILTRDHLPWWKRQLEYRKEAIDVATFPYLSEKDQIGLKNALQYAEDTVMRLEKERQ